MSSNPRLMSTLSQTGDTAVWLHNKLGSTNESWCDKTNIVSQLNAKVLGNIRDCFTELQTVVKLKLLLSFLHLSRRNLDEWKDELGNIIDLAVHDSDPWVQVVAEMLKNFPRNGQINFDLKRGSTNATHFYELVGEIKKCLKKNVDQNILPLESLFLNRNAFTSAYGQPVSPVTHFSIKRKSKSANLRLELVQKATDLSTGNKRSSTSSSVPIRYRGLNSNSTPMKGIPSRTNFNSNNSYSYGKSSLANRMSTGISRASRFASMSSSTPGMKRDGGIVLLDIGEAPSANQRDLKRRKTVSSLKANSQDQADKDQSLATPLSTVPSAPPTTPTSATTIAPSTPTVLGHKSTADQTSGHSNEPPSRAQLMSPGKQQVQDEQASLRVTASKSTPDYAAGLLGQGAPETSKNLLSSSNSAMNYQSPVKSSSNTPSYLNVSPISSSNQHQPSKVSTLRQTVASQSQPKVTQPSAQQFSYTQTTSQVDQQTSQSGRTSVSNVTSSPVSGGNMYNFQLPQAAPQSALRPQRPNLVQMSSASPKTTNVTLSSQQPIQGPSTTRVLSEAQSQPQTGLVYQQIRPPQLPETLLQQAPRAMVQIQQPIQSQQVHLQQVSPQIDMLRPSQPLQLVQPQPQAMPQQVLPQAMPQQLFRLMQEQLSHPSPTQPSPPLTPSSQSDTSAEQFLSEVRGSELVPPDDKKLIMEFLSSGKNPYPERGPVHTWRLSERFEIRRRPDNSIVRVMVEVVCHIDCSKGAMQRFVNEKIVQVISEPMMLNNVLSQRQIRPMQHVSVVQGPNGQFQLINSGMAVPGTGQVVLAQPPPQAGQQSAAPTYSHLQQRV